MGVSLKVSRRGKGKKEREKYRSIIVMMGATRPDAQAAEAISERTRKGKSLVFHF